MFEGIIEKGKMTLGKTKHQIYTEAHDNCAFVDKVISSLDIKNVNTKDYPIVGTAKIEEEDIPILDLASVFVNDYKKVGK